MFICYFASVAFTLYSQRWSLIIDTSMRLTFDASTTGNLVSTNNKQVTHDHEGRIVAQTFKRFNFLAGLVTCYNSAKFSIFISKCYWFTIEIFTTLKSSIIYSHSWRSTVLYRKANIVSLCQGQRLQLTGILYIRKARKSFFIKNLFLFHTAAFIAAQSISIKSMTS